MWRTRSPFDESRILRWALKLVGFGWTAFLVGTVPAALFTDAGLESHPLGKLGAWGDSGFEYVVMIAALNVGLGLYLVVASSNPAKYWCAIDIFLVCQTLHITSMGSWHLCPATICTGPETFPWASSLLRS